MIPAKEMRETLLQMLAVLQAERQAIAGLDFDAIIGTAANKQALCEVLGGAEPVQIDDECRGLLDAAHRLNEVNRQIRNLVAANVTSRLNSLTGSSVLYKASPVYGGAAA